MSRLVKQKIKKSHEDIINDPKYANDPEKLKRVLKRRKYERRLTKEGRLKCQDRNRKIELTNFLQKKSNASVLSLQDNIQRDRIFQAWQKLKEDDIKVCALDIEKANIQTVNGVKQLPIWIGVVDTQASIRFNEIVRYPVDSIVETNEKLHGVPKDIIKKAECFYNVRRKLIEVLNEYDRIIVAGGCTDFLSLGFLPDDWDCIQNKIRDVNFYYNCFHGQNQIALRYIIFCLFCKIIQDGQHSPIVDAGFTLFSYLIDMERFERIHNTTYSVMQNL